MSKTVTNKVFLFIIALFAALMVGSFSADAAAETSVKKLKVGNTYTIKNTSNVTSSKTNVAITAKKSSKKYTVTALRKGRTTLKVYDSNGKVSEKIYLIAYKDNSFKYDTSAIKMKVGKTKKVVATVQNGCTVKYKSSDKSVAKVNSKGKITAVSPGVATIKVKVYYKDTLIKTLRKQVTVKDTSSSTGSSASDSENSSDGDSENNSGTVPGNDSDESKSAGSNSSDASNEAASKETETEAGKSGSSETSDSSADSSSGSGSAGASGSTESGGSDKNSESTGSKQSSSDETESPILETETEAQTDETETQSNGRETNAPETENETDKIEVETETQQKENEPSVPETEETEAAVQESESETEHLMTETEETVSETESYEPESVETESTEHETESSAPEIVETESELVVPETDEAETVIPETDPSEPETETTETEASETEPSETETEVSETEIEETEAIVPETELETEQFIPETYESESVIPELLISYDISDVTLSPGKTIYAPASVSDGFAAAYSSSDTDVAAVSDDGTITGMSAGSAVIIVDISYDGTLIQTFSKSVTVRDYSLSASSLTIDNGESEVLTCSADGLYDADDVFTWSSSDSDIVAVNGSGNTAVVTGLKVGSATVTCELNDAAVYTCDVMITEEIASETEPETEPETKEPETDEPETEAEETESAGSDTEETDTETPETELSESESEVTETEAPEIESTESETDETDAESKETEPSESESEVTETEAAESEATEPETTETETQASESESTEPKTEETETEAAETESAESEIEDTETEAPAIESTEPDTEETETEATETESAEPEIEDTETETPETESKESETDVTETESTESESTEPEIEETETEATESEPSESESDVTETEALESETAEPETTETETEALESESTESDTEETETEAAETETEVPETESAEPEIEDTETEIAESEPSESETDVTETETSGTESAEPEIEDTETEIAESDSAESESEENETEQLIPELSVSYDTSEVTLSPGKSISAAAIVTDGYAVSYSSSDTNVATVSDDGTITGISAGSAIITVDVSYDDIVMQTLLKSVTVRNYSLSASSLTIDKGQAESLTCLADGTYDSNDTFVWSTDNETVASINGAGNSVTINGVSAGTAVITCVLNETVSFACDVTITPVFEIYYTPTKEQTINAGKIGEVSVYYDNPDDSVSFEMNGDNADLTRVTYGTCYDGWNESSCYYAQAAFYGRIDGSCTLSIYFNNELMGVVSIVVNGTDQDYFDYLEWKDALEHQLWDGYDLTDLQKIVKVGDYLFARYPYTDYSSKYCYSQGMGGDCIASSLLLIDIAIDLGYTGELFAPYESQGNYNHKRARIYMSDGEYEMEASNSFSRPYGSTSVWGPDGHIVEVTYPEEIETENESETETETLIPELSVSYDTAETTLSPGISMSVPATVTDGYVVAYSSSDTNVATVSDDGTITGVSAGTAVITVDVSYDGTVMQTCTKTVTVRNYSLSATSLEIDNGASEVLTCSADGLYDETDTFSWYSSDSSIVSVNASGNTATITGANVGSATVTCELNNTIVYTCEVTVNSVYIYHCSAKKITLNAGKVTSVSMYCEKETDVVEFEMSGDNAEISSYGTGTCHDSLNGCDSYYTSVSFYGRKDGECTLNVYLNGVLFSSVSVTVNGTDQDYYDYLEWKDALEHQLWDGYDLTDLQKIVKVGDYVFARYPYTDYSSKYCYSQGMGGDCIASSLLLIDIAIDLGYTGELYAPYESQGNYNHQRARIYMSDGEYDMEASNSTGNPYGSTSVWGPDGHLVEVTYPDDVETENESETETLIPELSVSYDESELTLSPGISMSVPATVTGGYSVAYSSSDMNVATVSEDGTITGISAGTVTITVDVSYDDTVMQTLTKTVTVRNYSLSATSLEIDNGSSEVLICSADGLYDDNDAFAWSSSDSNVVSVNSSGNTATITGLNVGSATVTCELNNTIVYTCEVTVNSVFIYHCSKTKVSVDAGKGSTITLYCENETDVVTYEMSSDNADIHAVKSDTCYDDLNGCDCYYTQASFYGRKDGECTLNVYLNGVLFSSIPITVNGTDQDYYDYLEWKDALEHQLWDGYDLTDLQKIVKVGDYLFARYPYTDYSSKYCYSQDLGGDCIASSLLLIDIAIDLGYDGELYTPYASQGNYNHKCACIHMSDGDYMMEASNSFSRPYGSTSVWGPDGHIVEVTYPEETDTETESSVPETYSIKAIVQSPETSAQEIAVTEAEIPETETIVPEPESYVQEADETEAAVPDAESFVQWTDETESVASESETEAEQLIPDEETEPVIPELSVFYDTSEVTLSPGRSICAPATVTDGYAVSYNSTDSNVASVLEDGTIIGISAGSAVIIVDVSYDGTVMQTLTKTVTVRNYSLSASSLSIDKSQAEAVSCIADGLYDPSDTFVWSTDNASVASISEAGNTVTINGVGAGTADITCVLNDTVSFTCVVTVNPVSEPVLEADDTPVIE